MSKPTAASLSHLCDLPKYRDETPYEIWADEIPAGLPRTNVQLEIVEGCKLTDVRDLVTNIPELSSHGFEWIARPFPSCGIASADDVGFATPTQQAALNSYLDSVSLLLKERYGCVKVLCWDWRVRRSKSTFPRTTPNIYSMKGKEGNELRATKINSSHLIHSDGSPGFMKKVLRCVTDTIEPQWHDTARYRIRGLTVWSPLVDVVEADPLVLCDTQTVEDGDWDVVQKVLDHSVEESMYLKRRQRHEWYWMSRQTRDEAIVMTIWDFLQPDRRKVSAPHCSMVLPNVAEEVKPRESIEVRLLVWNDLQEQCD